ncbi:hypothetical protein K504DRAFT_201752 [Pleomassaria siparia CBS 279.74]|uniref:Uncharacterized protein n=1 Tax=Pleomassaria siparia CBS 279.74 TaxID=1314801 RepID=A0A6G1KHM7_9PLEO|nr:hypothetical protein K504DRAFT_201752 [Pleomassaria siparia CBS 279.74]
MTTLSFPGYGSHYHYPPPTRLLISGELMIWKYQRSLCLWGRRLGIQSGSSEIIDRYWGTWRRRNVRRMDVLLIVIFSSLSPCKSFSRRTMQQQHYILVVSISQYSNIMFFSSQIKVRQTRMGIEGQKMRCARLCLFLCIMRCQQFLYVCYLSLACGATRLLPTLFFLSYSCSGRECRQALIMYNVWLRYITGSIKSALGWVGTVT